MDACVEHVHGALDAVGMVTMRNSKFLLRPLRTTGSRI
jgi:hypothetical protein